MTLRTANFHGKDAPPRTETKAIVAIGRKAYVKLAEGEKDDRVRGRTL